MTPRADSIRVMRPLFQAEEGGSTPTSALCLTVDMIGLDHARRLVKLWHSRLPRIDQRVAAWLCFVAEYGGIAYGVAIWSLPVARALLQDGTWLELRRLAIAPDAPRNTPSRVLGVMARLIHKLRPSVVRLVSYQDTEAHTGCIYRAAGWTPTTVHDGHGFDKSSRGRPAPQTESPKQRWEKELS